MAPNTHDSTTIRRNAWALFWLLPALAAGHAQAQVQAQVQAQNPPQAMPSPQLADDALNRCRLQTQADQRLACYDAIPTRPGPAVGAPLATVPAAPAAAARAFGLNTPTATLDAIDSSIAGTFEGWGERTVFTLANGQAWQVADGSSAALYLRDPKVRVRRGFGGAFYMEFEGSNRSPRVLRLR